MRKLIAVITAGLTLAGVVACANKGGDGDRGAGGPVTPSPIAITVNPSALPVGDTMPTGLVVNGKELVLYFWDAGPAPYLGEATRDTKTGAIDDRGGCVGSTLMGELSQPQPRAFLALRQCAAEDGTLIEYGALRADAARITSVAPGGTTTEATFARWSHDRTITVFWLQRKGPRVPDNIPNGAGRTTPRPDDQYPLISVYDANGRTLAAARIRRGATEPQGDG